jgi:hypothetical protein
MTIHKLQLEDFEDDDYSLIAVHSVLPNFRLAYFLNKQLHLQLFKNRTNHILYKNQTEVSFTHFIFEDEKNHLKWKLIENKKEMQVEKKANSYNLFEQIKDESTRFFLIPELKKIDYLLKIEGIIDEIQINQWMQKISQINNIQSAYLVNQNKLKTKNNLIF